MHPNQTNHIINFVANYQLSHVNKNNLHAYSPYYFNLQKECYIIDELWYQNLPQQIQKQLKQKFNPRQIVAIEYPHQVHKCYEYWEIYTWYNCSLYDFSRYIWDVSTINKQQIHLIKFQDDKQRSEFSQLFFKPNPKIENMGRLNHEIKQIFNKSQKQYFIKLTQRSGKNQIKLFPAKCLEDVYKNMIYSNDVKKEIYESSGILMREWKSFENSKEFRVFVFNRRIIGVSPQFYNKKIEWKEINFTKLINLLEEGVSKVKFSNSYVIDVMFIDNQRIWFLQFNPYGVYAASRSALFTLQQLLKMQQQKGLPVIKIVQN